MLAVSPKWRNTSVKNYNMLYIASDHAGFRLKEQIKSYLDELRIKYQDLGPKKFNPDDDYPDFAFKVAKKVAKNPNKDRGVLICATGHGMVLAANRIKGIRAVSAWDRATAEHARKHNNVNILALGGQIISLRKAKKIVSKWLSTKFEAAARHKRRLKKIEKV